MSSTTSAATSSSSLASSGYTGQTLTSFFTAVAASLVIFGIQLFAFLLLRNKLARIYKPKTYLVTERERTKAPNKTPWGWLTALFQISDRELINKCGLDAYFFLRYLQTLLVIFLPLAILILPILIPLNYVDGRGSNFASTPSGLESVTGSSGNGLDVTGSVIDGLNVAASGSGTTQVTGLDTIAWGNVKPENSQRYWAHLVLAVVVVVWVCTVIFFEFKLYIKVRQDYLTSAEHRLRASATTLLVSAIPTKWLTAEALAGLFDVYPGGIRNIWINRNYDHLLQKIKLRKSIFKKLESAETELIIKAKAAHDRQQRKDRKKQGHNQDTKADRVRDLHRANAAAERLAQDGGISAGDPHEVPHTVHQAIEGEAKQGHHHAIPQESLTFKSGLKAVGQGLGAMGQGLQTGLGAVGQGIQDVGKNVGKASDNVVGNVQTWGTGINDAVETTNGFTSFDRPESGEDFDKYGRYIDPEKTESSPAPLGAGANVSTMDKTRDLDSSLEGNSRRPASADNGNGEVVGGLPGNRVRRVSLQLNNIEQDNTFIDRRNWWKFWLGPSGAFPSPVPTGWEGEAYPLTRASNDSQQATITKKSSIWSIVKSHVFGPDMPAIEYPIAHNKGYREDATPAVWTQYLNNKDRPTHRLPRAWQMGWMTLPLINKKVDTIYWCREQLARLNVEIEADQENSDKFPLMNSAFIQFNHQVAAHMASQSVAHHIPKSMTPRITEIAPNDVIWDNMSVKWWQVWLKTFVVFSIFVGMLIAWIPFVAFSASLQNISLLSTKYTWLNWLDRAAGKSVIAAIGGVLPTIILSVTLVLVPLIFEQLALMRGAQTLSQQQGFVQQYFFTFLFFQVFLVASLAGSLTAAAAIISDALKNTSYLFQLLAQAIPKAANYYFNYITLQALSVSSGTLLQPLTLLLWFVIAKLVDNTARQKWRRNTNLPGVTWGSYFPVYTNFACIAIIYSVVAPIMLIFAIIAFTLLWIANRYSMLYVVRFKSDTGGTLYPRALNQTFTGLYVFEFCLAGLFFIVVDENNTFVGIPQGVIMVVILAMTIMYHILLNMSFHPLMNSLPITFEDEAVLRDQAFARAQARRLGLETDTEDGNEDEMTLMTEDMNKSSIPMETIALKREASKSGRKNPMALVTGAGSWALRSTKQISALAISKGDTRDIEAQRRIGNALFGGYNDEIEDLMPEERDTLVRYAFLHSAVRERRPTVWIPRDDLGVSDDEIKRTREYGNGNIWISNVGSALDGNKKVVYGKNPPDFSEVDLINL